MARTRYLKPSFFHNADLSRLPAHARLLFAGLWCLADREGRLRDVPDLIKGNLFPEERVPVVKLLNALEGSFDGESLTGFMLRYQVSGKRCIWIPTFLRHQKPHQNEAKSELPPHPQEAAILAFLGQGWTAEGDTSAPTNVQPTFDQRYKDVALGERGKGKEERDLLGKGERGTGNAPNGTGPASSLHAPTSWDFSLSLFRQVMNKPDPSKQDRDALRSLYDRVPDKDWLLAAINQSAASQHPGIGYIKNTLEDCIAKNEPPSSLKKTQRTAR